MPWTMAAGLRVPHVIGELFRGDLHLVRHDHRTFQHILELSDVPRPLVGCQDVHRLRLDPFHGHTQALSMSLEEVSHEQGDLLRAMAQRR